MSDDIPAGFSYHIVSPEGRDGLKFRVLLHGDFGLAELPSEEIDFETTHAFLPLLVAGSNYGPMVLTVAARPAYADGTVSQWLDFLCRQEGYARTEIREVRIGLYEGVFCDARQVADRVTLRMRLALIEDGGRLFQLSVMAPEELFEAVEPRLMTMLGSFDLASDAGPTVARMPGGPVEVAGRGTPPAAPSDGAEAVTTNTDATAEIRAFAPEAGGTPPTAAAPISAPASAAPQDSTPPSPAPSGGTTARLTPEEFAEVVLAAEATSLDPEQPINANLRDRGIGLVPRVLSTDPTTKSARIGAGAVQAILRVPFGWHVIDDGRRTLVFDAGGRMQISLDQRLHEGLSVADFGRGMLAPLLANQPDLPVVELTLEGISAVGVRGAEIEGETLDQVFMVRDLGREGLYLVARVTAAPADSRLALNLAGDLMATLEFV